MNNITDLLEASSIGLIIATFLLNTGRGQKVIEVCKECLILLNIVFLKKGVIFDSLNMAIYQTVFKASFFLLGYTSALRYGRELLGVYRECGETAKEGDVTLLLADICEKQFEYIESRELYKRAMTIMIETGDRKGEAYAYEKFGIISSFLGEYDKAKMYINKGLTIRIEMGGRKGEAADYFNLGTMSFSLGEYDKAKEYLEKTLVIRIELGDKEGAASAYGHLAAVFHILGEYDKTKDHLEDELAIRIKLGDRAGEATDYEYLGMMFRSLGKFDKAMEYLDKALAIRMEMTDRTGEANCSLLLGTVLLALGEYEKANQYLENALAMKIEAGDSKGAATAYGNLGSMFLCLFDHDNAKRCLEKAVAMNIETGQRAAEANCYVNLGILHQLLGEYVIAEYFVEKALSIIRDLAHLDKELELDCLCALTMVQVSQSKMEEAFEYLVLSMNKSENLRSLLGDNDQFKISSSNFRNYPYRALSAFFCSSAKPNRALYVLELARARALADLLSSQYSVESQISADLQSWIGIENIMKRESNCFLSLLFVLWSLSLFLWVLKANGIIKFRSKRIDEKTLGARLVDNLEDFFAKGFRSFGIRDEQYCEDRSLNSIPSVAASRIVEDDDEGSGNSESSVSLYYRMLISPVADVLEESEIIVVPDRSLNQVPFSALMDEGGRYLSETFRIRIVPSLTTLKLIKDSTPDYHSQTGALIVGDPDVGWVHYKGTKMFVSRLPCAGNEAAMIARLLAVQPLLGQDATKQAVLERLHSVSLIHFAAHGNAERGEIALSHAGSLNRIPEEKDYLLMMSEIAQVQLRAKLVVLSCCHSACGQIGVEGVIGIARAFLGSGARSVLVALWAISDKATEQLMCRFYEHLVRGESASESLHQAMKWMRGNGFDHVCDWAPFLLIGDNVTFDFGK